ncbi:MAG: D-2-hydroxyacid dehydrogenase [Bacteroidales bacterium]
MIKIVFLDAYSVGKISLEPITAVGDITLHSETKAEETVERCKGFEVVITNKVKLLRDEIDQLPELKLICVAATGVNNIDVEYAQSKGIEVKNVPQYSTQSVAESTFNMVLALLHNTAYYNDYVQSGDYAFSNKCFNLNRNVSEISAKRWGIIGMGAIGQRVAAIATAFGAEVSYYSTSGANNSQPYACVSLSELLSSSDIVTIHAPLNNKTENLIGADELKQMKPSAILVNLGRGGIIDEDALAQALNNNTIAGAGIDVFEYEPMRLDNPLLRLNDKYKLVAAPHCGWASEEARTVLINRISQNITDYVNRK